jgi:hypothetical protein
MIQNINEHTAKTNRFLELRTIWANALWIFLRRFHLLRDEIAAATWSRFIATILTTLIISSGVNQLVFGLSYKGIYESTLRTPFNLFGFWLVETFWTVTTSALIDIPFILLVAYLSFYWVSHAKDENAHWLQEAHMLAITWAFTVILAQAVYLLGGSVREALFGHMNFATRAIQERRYSPILSYLFSGLLTAPIIAYRYNLRLHGNKMLNSLTGRDRWLLLGFQFIVLEGGILLVSQFVLHLPFVINLHQTLGKLWI